MLQRTVRCVGCLAGKGHRPLPATSRPAPPPGSAEQAVNGINKLPFSWGGHAQSWPSQPGPTARRSARPYPPPEPGRPQRPALRTAAERIFAGWGEAQATLGRGPGPGPAPSRSAQRAACAAPPRLPEYPAPPATSAAVRQPRQDVCAEGHSGERPGRGVARRDRWEGVRPGGTGRDGALLAAGEGRLGGRQARCWRGRACGGKGRKLRRPRGRGARAAAAGQARPPPP